VAEAAVVVGAAEAQEEGIMAGVLSAAVAADRGQGETEDLARTLTPFAPNAASRRRSRSSRLRDGPCTVAIVSAASEDDRVIV